MRNTLLGYLFMAIALAAGATKGHFSKKTGGAVNTIPNISLMHGLRMFFCIVIGFFFVLIQDGKGMAGFAITWKEFLPCLLSGIAMALFIITWVLCVKKSAYAMLSVFLVISTLIPTVFSYFIWGKEIKPFWFLGFVILIGGVVMMCIYNVKEKGQFTTKGIIYLILCAIFNGLAALIKRWWANDFKGVMSANSFNFYSFIISFVVMMAIGLIGKGTSKNKEKFSVKSIFFYILILSICLFINSLFEIKANAMLPAAILYPINQGLGLVIAMLLGHFFYDEKINRYSLIGIGLTIVSFVFMII